MAIKKVGLSWFAVSCFKKAEQFYVYTLGFESA